MEKDLEKIFVTRIRRLGGWAIKMPAVFVTGLPDRLCLLPEGRCFFVELKQEGQKPKKIQKYVHEKLRKLGFEVKIIDKISQIVELC